MPHRIPFLFCVAVAMLPTLAAAAPIVISVGGDNTAASIQPAHTAANDRAAAAKGAHSLGQNDSLRGRAHRTKRAA